MPVFKIQRHASYTICVNSTLLIPEPYKCFKKNLILYTDETDLKELDKSLDTTEARSLVFLSRPEHQNELCR